MKVAANILLAGMLLFGFATFALILETPQTSAHWKIYLAMLLILSCGIALYILFAFLSKRLKKTEAENKQWKDAVSNAEESNIETANSKSEGSIDSYAGKIGSYLQKIKDVKEEGDKVLSVLSKVAPISHGLLYLADDKDEFHPIGKYAYYSEEEPASFSIGEGINGQVAKDMQPFTINDLPDNYVNIVSGLGHAQPRSITITPIVKNERTIALCEVGFLKQPSNNDLKIVKLFCDSLVDKVSLN